VITTAGNLPARYVIHTVGPVYGEHEGREAQLLAACYQNSLRLAASHSLTSIAFPAISTGAFSYPRHEAANVSSEAILHYLEDAEGSNATLKEVRLIFLQRSDADKFLKHHKFG
jgi:O-acetyl-ADP-ribose deacetylase (regulator of RNase III)